MSQLMIHQGIYKIPTRYKFVLISLNQLKKTKDFNSNKNQNNEPHFKQKNHLTQLNYIFNIIKPFFY